MFFTFPRRVALPKRHTIYNSKQLVDIINRYNGVTHIFIEIYKMEGQEFIIDKIFFDIDNPENIGAIKKLHQYCMEKNLKHCMIYSGRGYHFYIKTTSKPPKFPKACLSRAQRKIAEACGLVIGDPHEADIDFHTHGNLAQVARIPYTINPKTGRYCCFLTKGLLDMGQKMIEIYAHKPIKKPVFYGKYPLSLSNYDIEEDVRLETPTAHIDSNVEVKENFHDCIKNMLRNKDLRYRERFQLILAMRDIYALSLKECVNLLGKYLSPDKYNHCINEERQPQILYKTDEFFFKHDEVWQMGYCKDNDCKLKNYYKVFE